MQELRCALREITCDLNIDNHYSRIESIKDRFHHKIDLIEKPPLWPKNYNCFEFALSVYQNKEYIGLKYTLRHKKDNGIFINSKFIQFLIDDGILIENQKGSLIIYFDSEDITHAGILKNKRVTSKWGEGNLYEHAILEVPKQYGDTYRLFENIKEDFVMNCFNDFVNKYDELFLGDNYE